MSTLGGQYRTGRSALLLVLLLLAALGLELWGIRASIAGFLR